MGCHHPRKRVIQYSRGSNEMLRRRGVLDALLAAFAKASSALTP
jgi:hypothetical protein